MGNLRNEVTVQADFFWPHIFKHQHSQGSFVEEDVDRIPQAMKTALLKDYDVFQGYSFHDTFAALGQMDVRLTKTTLNPTDPLTSMGGRLVTFPEQWTGPCKRLLAQAGFYYELGRVECVFCGAAIRSLKEPGKCPWQEHQGLVPHCPQLVKYMCHGLKPAPEGKRKRLSSQSSACDVLQHDKLMMTSSSEQRE